MIRKVVAVTRLLIYFSFLCAIPALTEKTFAGEGIDAVLVIDSSGSMKQTDPRDLRKEAARLFITLLDREDKAAIMSFATDAKVLNGLTGAGDKINRDLLAKAIYRVNSQGLYTNIYKGLKRGFELFDPDTANEKILILLSDGKMDLGDAGMEESLTANMINSLLPEMTKARIKVYTIAFTEQSDRLLLEKIAEKTGGFFTLANADRDLHVVFSSLFEKIKSPDSLPLQGGGFSVDKDVQELTLLVTKKSPSASITISSPSAKRFSAKDHAPDMSWFESTLFEMITMKQPMPGQWSAHLSSEEGNKIFVITNLRLRSSFNVNFVAQGTTLNVDAWLEKDGNHLRARDILRHVRISARLETPEGKPITLALHNVEDSVDGVYRSQFRADQPGDYSIRLTAEAATFKREKEFFFRTARASPPQSPAHSSLPGVTQRQIQDRKASFSWAVVLLKFAIINMALAFLITGGHYAKRYLAKVRGHSNAAH